jgi:hypothetical protein
MCHQPGSPTCERTGPEAAVPAIARQTPRRHLSGDALKEAALKLASVRIDRKYGPGAFSDMLKLMEGNLLGSGATRRYAMMVQDDIARAIGDVQDVLAAIEDVAAGSVSDRDRG